MKLAGTRGREIGGGVGRVLLACVLALACMRTSAVAQDPVQDPVPEGVKPETEAPVIPPQDTPPPVFPPQDPNANDPNEQDAKPAPVESPPIPAEKPVETPAETPPRPNAAPTGGAAGTDATPASIPLANSGAPAPADYARTFEEAAFEAELARLVAAHPSRLRITSLGTSKQGRRIALATLGELAGDPDQRPAALLATDLEARFGERPGGPEAALYVMRTLLERAEREPELAELLTGVTLYAVPAPDPDGVFAVGGALERTCRLERNFPAGWQPSDAIDCPQGPYPCSEPETRELARLVAQRTNVGGLALLARQTLSPTLSPILRDESSAILNANAARPAGGPGGGTVGGTGGGTVENALAHVAARAALDATTLIRARDAALAQPGSLAAFARARAGACVLVMDPWSGEPAGADGVRAGFAALPGAVEALLRELPRLDGKSLRAERLRERLWLVEVELRVSGGLPTASAEERARAPASVWLDVEGARVSKIGLRRDEQPVGNLDVPRGKTWRIGHLAGNETVRLYLAVEGDEGGTLRLAFRSLRGGHAEFDVALGG